MPKSKKSPQNTDAPVVKPVSVGELKVCHLADIHLGYRRYNKLSKGGINQREIDVNVAFQESISRVIALKPDLTIIAGDLFHSVRPSNSVLTFCFRQLRRLAKETGAPVVIISGNHETPKRADSGSVLQLLAEIEGVWVADTKLERFNFPEIGASVTCLPHAALLEGIGEGLRADDRFKHNLLVVHAQVNERWLSDFGGVELALQALSPFEWDYIALGHVHVYRNIAPNAGYSGAIEHTAANMWGEAKELKGFVEVTLPNVRRTFHALTSPREVVVLDPIDALGMEPGQISAQIKDRIENVAGGIEGKIVKLEIVNISREAYRYLDHKELRVLRTQALNFTLDFKTESLKPEALEAFEQKSTLRQQLQVFCEQQATNVSNIKETESLLLKYLDLVEANREAP